MTEHLPVHIRTTTAEAVIEPTSDLDHHTPAGVERFHA